MTPTTEVLDEEATTPAAAETGNAHEESRRVESGGPALDMGQDRRRTIRGTATRAVVFGVLPGIAFLLALGAAWLKWQDTSIRATQTAASQAAITATEGTVALLSYEPETVDRELLLACDRLTGNFRGAYESLINDVVIPGAKEKQISAVAAVPAAAPVSANPRHAVVLVFVNQTTTIGDSAPTQTASSVTVTLDKVADRWLISDFTPI